MGIRKVLISRIKRNHIKLEWIAEYINCNEHELICYLLGNDTIEETMVEEFIYYFDALLDCCDEMMNNSSL